MLQIFRFHMLARWMSLVLQKLAQRSIWAQKCSVNIYKFYFNPIVVFNLIWSFILRKPHTNINLDILRPFRSLYMSLHI